MKLPAKAYLHLKIPKESLQLRIDKKLKTQILKAAAKLDSNATKFVEAAIEMYLDRLKEEGHL